MKSVVWFRGMDLRFNDHSPLWEGVRQGQVIPVYVQESGCLDPVGGRDQGYATQAQRDGLQVLKDAFENAGSRLYFLPGDCPGAIAKVVQTSKADQVLAYRSLEPLGVEMEARVQKALGPVPLRLFDGQTLVFPGRLRNRQGGPFRVFTPFARAFREQCHVSQPVPGPVILPEALPLAMETLSFPALESPELTGIESLPRGGEQGARERLNGFLKGGLAQYPEARDRMDLNGTSRLSQDLHFGFLSVAQVWHSVIQASQGESARSYCNELLWREFAYHLCSEDPRILQEPFRIEFSDFPWIKDEAAWSAWVFGQTGYPIVDAAARQLLQTGFVHNRARMIAASFLTKHLMQDYRLGESHYLKWLADADLACNNMGWQWSAGCGVDAQPWFRIFHPVLQGKRFDPLGDYVRRWVPELSAVPTRYIHAPWEAPSSVLESAHLRLGTDYPLPIVDHAWARERFLATAKGHLEAFRRSNDKGRLSTPQCNDV